MKFTYYCEPGRFLSPRTHFIYIGGWIRPEGYIVLQHGNLSYLEHKKITEQGYIRIFENHGVDYSYIEPIAFRSDLQRYRDLNLHRGCVGTLIQKNYNLYAGRVLVYGRVIK